FPSKPNCKCQKLMAKCTKGANICDILEEGQGPHIMNLRKNGPDFATSNPLEQMLTDLDNKICTQASDWAVETLAGTLIHEGSHLTSRLPWRVATDNPADGECQAKNIEAVCMK